ncbi:MAG: SRPBCC family protein [Actinomycetota bacterium]|nr:SRPBCC family protein [Actinomycetota bacterium]
MVMWSRVLAATVGGAGLVAGYVGVVSGAVTVEVGLGRRVRPLGPLEVLIAAPRATVFDVLSEPYLGRQSRAVAEKIKIWARGSDMVLAAHRTPIRGRLVATTVESVTFTRPELVEFRLARGPVPHVFEQFRLTGDDHSTRLRYVGELGTDGWALGARWGDLVAGRWERTVSATFLAVKAEAERRTGSPHGRDPSEGPRRDSSTSM